jgi:hypothetical protein
LFKEFESYSLFFTKFLLIVHFLAFFSFFSGCANQLPPGGGEEDKEPPKIVTQNPLPNSLNYNGNSITLEFDKYVDRRSLQDAFLISPPMGGDINYDWSGKEVEITFSKKFSSVGLNKTFVITLNSTLKDLHGNSLTQPINFAFSTGPKIDKAGISGKIINNEGKMISIFAYKLTTIDTEYNPTKKLADYITESSINGEYHLSNLSPGLYRVIAVFDEDKNFLYTAEREDYGVLSRDLNISDTEKFTDRNFNLNKISHKKDSAVTDISGYFKDSLDIIYTSIENESKSVLPDQSIFIYFNKFRPSREDFVRGLNVSNGKGTNVKIIFNWLNDSLVEVFAVNKFEFNESYTLSFKINTAKDSTYNFILKYTIISQNSFGELKGFVRNKNVEDSLLIPVHFDLVSKEIRPEIKYSFDIFDTVFNFKNIAEADYTLFAYIDMNRNGKFDFGNPFPFEYSEPFYLYPHDVTIRGGWAVEDVIIDFKK